jgi:aminobenzoyl-glutamate utilization protein B
MATGTEAKMRLYTAINHVRQNETGAKVMHANLQLIGPPVFTQEEQEFARQIQKAIGLEEKGLEEELSPLEPGEERDLDNYIGSGSTDVAEVSLVTPEVSLSVTTFVKGTPGHNWANVACSGTPIGIKGMLVAAKVLAATAIDLMQQPETLAAMRAEFDEMMDGKVYVSSIPPDVDPPILPNPYTNPQWEPGDLDYPTWGSIVLPQQPMQQQQ